MKHKRELTPALVDWESADAQPTWTGLSSGLFLIVAAMYWLAAWLTAGLPPLALVAARGLRHHQSATGDKTASGGNR